MNPLGTWLGKMGGLAMIAVASGSVCVEKARSSIPKPPDDPSYTQIFWHIAGGNDPLALIAAVFAAVGTGATFYQLLFQRPYTKDDGIADRKHQNASFKAADRQQVTRHEAEMDELGSLHAKIDALTEQIAKVDPTQAASFATAAGNLIDSDDAEDRATARTVAEGQLEKGADDLMRDVRAGKRRNAERARQAARIYAPVSPSKAKEAYEEAVSLDPTDLWSWIELGRLRAVYDSLDSAELAFKNGLQRVVGKRDRSVLHNEFGDLLMARGELTKAREKYEAGLTIAERLAKAEPGNAQGQRDLSVSYQRLGDVEVAAGDLNAARARFEEGLTIAERLAKAEPGNAQGQRDLSVSYNKLGDVEVAAGDLNAARARFEEGLTIAERLAKAEPGNAQGQRDLSVSYERLGDVEVAAGDLKAARARFEECLTIRERLAKPEPGNAEGQRDLSVSYEKLGDVEVAAGDLKTARARFEECLTIRERLAKAEPGNAQWQRDLSVSYNKLGDVEVLAGDLKAARARFEESLTIAERLAKAEPGNAQGQRDLWASNGKLGQLALQEGNATLALTHFREAERVMAVLVNAWPDHPGFADALATVRRDIAQIGI